MFGLSSIPLLLYSAGENPPADTTPPAVVGLSFNRSAATLSVGLADAGGLDASTIQDAAFKVRDPANQLWPVVVDSTPPAAGATTATVVLRIYTTPPLPLDETNAGTWTLLVGDLPVKDAAGNAMSGTIGTFVVSESMSGGNAAWLGAEFGLLN